MSMPLSPSTQTGTRVPAAAAPAAIASPRASLRSVGGYEAQSASLRPSSQPSYAVQCLSTSLRPCVQLDEDPGATGGMEAVADPELWTLLDGQTPISADDTARTRELLDAYLADLDAAGYDETAIEVERARCYELLTNQTLYYSQRDNATGTQGTADRMCNLTTLANTLTFHGVANPEPDRQLEDVLEDRLRALPPDRLHHIAGVDDRTVWENWREIASDLGLETGAVTAGTSERRTAGGMAAFVEATLRAIFQAGGTVIAGLDQACAAQTAPTSEAGHIVRVKSSDDAGVTIDDPYGNFTDGAGSARWYDWNDEGVEKKRIQYTRNEAGASSDATRDAGGAFQAGGASDPGVGQGVFLNWQCCVDVNLFKTWMRA